VECTMDKHMWTELLGMSDIGTIGTSVDRFRSHETGGRVTVEPRRIRVSVVDENAFLTDPVTCSSGVWGVLPELCGIWWSVLRPSSDPR
jgi:hypothetical protein